MRVLAITLFIAGFMHAVVYADESTGGNVESFFDRVNVRAFFTVETLLLSVDNDYRDSTGASRSSAADYQPNPYSGDSIGVEIIYQGLGFSFSKYTGTSGEEDKYGSSEAEGAQLYFFSGNLGFDVYYQNYTGFYLQDPGSFGLNEGDPATIRQDLSVSFTGVNAYYIFSDRYSLMAAFKQTERQIESGGSFMLMVSAMHFSVSSDYPLIPAAYDGGKYRGFTDGSFYGISLSPGYAYTLTLNNFFVSAMIFFGGGVMKKHYDAAEGDIQEYGIFTKINTKASLGYNGDLFFTGLTLLIDTTSTGVFLLGSAFEVYANVSRIELFAGYRF